MKMTTMKMTTMTTKTTTAKTTTTNTTTKKKTAMKRKIKQEKTWYFVCIGAIIRTLQEFQRSPIYRMFAYTLSVSLT